MCQMCTWGFGKDMLELGFEHVAAAQSPGKGQVQTPTGPAPAAPAAPTAAPFPSFKGMVPAYPPGQGPAPVTTVNSTGDPRVIWEDGHVAIIYAKDFPAGTGMGRSKTRADIKDAINAAVDDLLHTMPGKNAQHDFVKVWLKDLLARPLHAAGGGPKVMGRLPIDPAQFKPVAPVIAQSGSYAGQIIPDFPHDCAACGQKYYQGNFSSVHNTPDGKCPSMTNSKAPTRRR